MEILVAAPVELAEAAERAKAHPPGAVREPSGALFGWLVWSPAIVIILSATAVTGGIALFLVPLLGLFYGFFCLVACAFAGEEVDR